ncbi:MULTISPECIES: hypothetical protein [unclassified Actinopolyspora]|uniref:hypothetical protein n=1 Tax=Actinopolyspora TaxID=1849 RepID=UPI0013F59ACF|nr:hypothetical protein [Actinopolyspora sp. BKK2]NHE78403.1 hypothetical protein [Actinopolyspora sp. BKK1]
MTSRKGSIFRKSAASTATLLAATLSLGLSGTASGDVTQQTGAQQTGAQDTKAAPAPAQFSPIQERYWNEPHLRRVLGNPVDSEQSTNGMSYQEYQHGWMYHTEDTGAHEVHGAISDRYEALGGHSNYNVPITDELPTPDEVGRFNHFAGTEAIGTASIYWTADTGAHGVWGPVREFWGQRGFERGYLDYPVTDTADTQEGDGVYTHFRGADHAGASVYWNRATGTHSVRGTIRELWLSIGAETSWLGYPDSNEYGVPGGRRSDFQGGYIYWNASTGKATAHRY